MIEKFNEKENWFKNKLSKKAKLARIFDLNKLIDSVNSLFTTSDSRITALETAEPVSEYTYIEVPVSSAQILAMGSSPIELLPAVGVSAYYDIPKYIIEYTHETTPYTLGDFLYVGLLNSAIYDGIDASLITFGENLPYVGALTNPWDATDVVNKGIPQRFNDSFILGTWGGVDPTLGDGTLLVKIWYKVKTFGTEL